MIDVLLPFYGDPRLLRVAVRSVLRQTDPDWRLVVVDDCYPDPTVEAWVRGLRDTRVSYHRNAANLGANANYTRALSLASASHVVFMGADDIMAPDYLAVMAATIERHPDAGALTCGVRVIDGRGATVSPLVDRIKGVLTPRAERDAVVCAGESALVRLLQGNWTYFPAVCWRRELVTEIGFRPGFGVVQDLALLVDVIRSGRVLVRAPEVAFCYRRHLGSDSARKSLGGGARFREELHYFAVIAAELEADGMHRAARAARMHLTSRAHAGSLLWTSVARGDVPAARALARHVVLARG